MTISTVRPDHKFDYYQGTVFWTNFDVVLSHLSKLISGDPTIWWPDYVHKQYGPQKSAFILNCGNGWVEREFYQKGFIGDVTAIDIMPRHIDEASLAAKNIGMPSNYILADSNTFQPGELQVDVAINVGAMHHVAYINRMTAVLAQITENGYYISYDYTGAHRNQYSWDVWSKVIEVNQALPETYRARLRYPHFNTMIASDPSEAVHSELQTEVLMRYFDVLEYRRLGGGIAHQLLFENRALYADQHKSEAKAVIDFIIKSDAEALSFNEDFNLWSFYVAKPKKAGSVTQMQVLEWQAEENEREALAAQNGGRYYPPLPLELIYNDLAMAEYLLSINQKA